VATADVPKRWSLFRAKKKLKCEKKNKENASTYLVCGHSRCAEALESVVVDEPARAQALACVPGVAYAALS
jgi:hypothetical protein